jgi:hypothetical protein
MAQLPSGFFWTKFICWARCENLDRRQTAPPWLEQPWPNVSEQVYATGDFKNKFQSKPERG